MAFFEKYSFYKGVNKDLSPGGISSDGQRRLFPGFAYNLKNCRLFPVESGKLWSIENVRGNELIVNGNLSGSGTNKVVGSLEDVEKNSIIYFVYNTSGNHSIHRYYPFTATFEKILEWSGLAFSGKPIRGIGKAGEVLYWADATNDRTINLADVSLGKYTTVVENSISLYKQPPLTLPTAIKDTDNTKTTNRITADSFQFAYRFIYRDNSFTRLSPRSKAVFADLVSDQFSTTNNRIRVTVSVPSNIRALIKKIEVFFVKNNGLDYYLFEEIQNPSTTSYTLNFYNDYAGFRLSDQEASISDESIPRRSDALAFFKDRLFVTNSLGGLNVNDGSVTATVSKVELSKRSGLQFKENGVYTFGIKFSDTDGRNSLIRKIGSLNFKKYQANQSGINSTLREYARVNVSGTSPSWATRYQIVLSEESNFSTYSQFKGAVLFPLVANPENGEVNFNGIFNLDGYVYFEDKQGNNVSRIHLMLPYNMPIVPDSDTYIRCISNPSYTKTEKIDKFIGDRVEIVGNFGINNWSSINTVEVFEIFKLKDTSEEKFYEVGVSNSIPANKVIPPTEVILEGDTHIVNVEQWNPLIFNNIEDNINYFSDFESSGIDVDSYTLNVESPTPTTTQKTESAEELKSLAFLPENFQVTLIKSIILDYSKKANHFGRVFALQKDNGEVQEPNKIRFSDTYVQDSSINGLHNFTAVNQKNIPRELSPIVALVPVGNNVMLAVHERAITSLAVGDGFIKTSDANLILTKTEEVIGDDRELQGSLGTIFHGSIQSHEGRAFGFDIFKGAVWQYSVNGLFPISKFGMKSHFKKLAKDYLPYKDQIQIVSGIDNYHSEYLITFPPIGELQGETWGYNYEENTWVSYDFLPDYYAKVGDKLYAFKNGNLYEHNKTSTYNNFYGEQYERSIVFYANPMVTKNKRLLNVHIIAYDLANDDELKVITVRTPSGQETYIRKKWFEKKEGTWYAEVLKDINTPNVTAGRIALRDGQDIRGKYFEVEFKTDLTDKAVLYGIQLVFVESEYSR